jgi:hypothetical protein
MPEKWSHVLDDQMILNSKNCVRVCKHVVKYDLKEKFRIIYGNKIEIQSFYF